MTHNADNYTKKELEYKKISEKNIFLLQHGGWRINKQNQPQIQSQIAYFETGELAGLLCNFVWYPQLFKAKTL